MKTGIIITFHNNEKEIDKHFFIQNTEHLKNIEICLVNNNSQDNTYNILKEISESCSNVSVVNIKKHKTEISAVRAGARYMVNQFNLKEIGYINANMLKSGQKELNKVIRVIVDFQDEIFDYKTQVSQQKKIKQSLIQNVFSLLECMVEFKKDYHKLSFQV